MFANQQAFRQLLKLWSTWQRGEDFQRGLTKWRDVFALLRDIRLVVRPTRRAVCSGLARPSGWGEKLPADRAGFALMQQRAAAATTYARGSGTRGRWHRRAVIADIHYHTLAVRLPITAVQDLLDADRRGSVALVQAEQIQFFRASGQMTGRIMVDQLSQLAHLPDEPPPDPQTQPVVALLDGLPLQSHRALAGRLSVDDPDDFGADYEAQFRLHGTAMASLIIWGDLHSPGEPIPRYTSVRSCSRSRNQGGMASRQRSACGRGF
ncbi:MAG: hypothetical protein IPN78_05390 [Candidatus Accumulibacter sp.]|nr:hypothetical protein [Candidatus Accumulibacter propinquus]